MEDFFVTLHAYSLVEKTNSERGSSFCQQQIEEKIRLMLRIFLRQMKLWFPRLSQKSWNVQIGMVLRAADRLYLAILHIIQHCNVDFQNTTLKGPLRSRVLEAKQYFIAPNNTWILHYRTVLKSQVASSISQEN